MPNVCAYRTQKQIPKTVWEFANWNVQFYNQKEAQKSNSMCLVAAKARGNSVLAWLFI